MFVVCDRILRRRDKLGLGKSGVRPSAMLIMGTNSLV